MKGGIAAAKLAQELLVENPELIKAEAKINSALRKSKVDWFVCVMLYCDFAAMFVLWLS